MDSDKHEAPRMGRRELLSQLSLTITGSNLALATTQVQRVCGQAYNTMDFSMSIVRITGAKAPPSHEFDSIDILKLVETSGPHKKRKLWRGRRGERIRQAIRDGDMKYIHSTNSSWSEEYPLDLIEDMSETRDLLEKQSKDFKRLKALLADWEKEVKHA